MVPNRFVADTHPGSERSHEGGVASLLDRRCCRGSRRFGLRILEAGRTARRFLAEANVYSEQEEALRDRLKRLEVQRPPDTTPLKAIYPRGIGETEKDYETRLRNSLRMSRGQQQKHRKFMIHRVREEAERLAALRAKTEHAAARPWIAGTR